MKDNVGKGVITAMITPLNCDETVDVVSLKKVIERMTNANMSGIFTMSTTGECLRLAQKEQELLMNKVAEFNDSKSLLYIGISGTGLKLSIENIKRAEKVGADVLVSTLPFYFSPKTVEEQIQYFKAIAENTELPILIYNIPECVGTKIELDTIKALIDIPNIIGIKDSSGNDEYFLELLKYRTKSFNVLNGVEFKASWSYKNSADGIVPSLSSIYPQTYMDMYNAALKEDWKTVDAYQEKINLINSIHKKHVGRLNVVTCRKILLEKEGLGFNNITAPYIAVPEELKNELIKVSSELNLN